MGAGLAGLGSRIVNAEARKRHIPKLVLLRALTGREAVSMLLLRTLTGTSIFVLVLTGAIAAPIALPPKSVLPPPPPPLSSPQWAPYAPFVAIKDTDITGSLGSQGIRGLPDGELATLRATLDSYNAARLSAGDGIARGLSDPAARALAEWIAIRTAPRQVGHSRIMRFLAKYPNWPSAPLLKRLAEEALYYDAADAGTVRAYFSETKPVTDEGKVALAAALLQGGDKKGAAALIRDAYRNDDLPSELEARILKTYGSLLTRADLKYRADRLTYDQKYAEALKAAKRAGEDVVALVKARMAVEKKAKNAGSLLAAVPKSLHGDPAYLIARIGHLRKTDKPQEAAALMLKAPRDPASLIRPDEWWTERRLVAREMLDAGDFRTAYAIASAFTAQSDTTAMEAEFHAGWIALRFLGDGRKAARHFAALSARAERPISIARGAYWQGRAAEAMGDSGAARRFYEVAARHSTTYYGQIARARIGLNSVALRPLPAPTAGVKATFNGLLATRAINMLYELNERTHAAVLVADFANRLQDADHLSLLGEMVTKRKDMKAALSIGKSATQRGLPLERVAFPVGGLPSYQAVNEVEKAVVFGIARQESEFRHDAVSHAGARGLMQVMPATAKATAKAAGLPFDAKRLTSDPAYNAQIGAAHLGELIDKFGGSYIMTFAAYNAGPSRVAEWVSTYGDPRSPHVDPIDWVERIPYSETRNYVQRVMENVQVYRARLGKETLVIESDLRRGMVQ
jgi:soluble lytic murein transglycosylase